MSQTKEAIDLWVEQQNKILKSIFPPVDPRQKRIQISVNYIRTIQGAMTRFQITKQRVLVDKLVAELEARTEFYNKTKEEYKSTPFYKFKRRKLLKQSATEIEVAMKQFQAALLIVVNTLPPIDYFAGEGTDTQ